MTKRQRELVLWLGQVQHCGTRGINRAGWATSTIERCQEAGWVERSPNHRFSWVATPAGIKRAVSV